MRAIPFASLPFLCAGLLVAAWHFAAYSVLLPISLATLLFPASFGYAGVLLLEPSAQQGRTPRLPRILAGLSIVTALVAYACSLYGNGSVLQLIPEIYKFGGSVVSLNQSTVALWAGLTAASSAIASANLIMGASTSVAHRVSRATLGMSAGTVVMFVPLLTSSHVAFR
jgi:hypothetical protein